MRRGNGNWCDGNEVNEGTVGASKVAWSGVEDGVVLGEDRGPAARLAEGALLGPWGSKDWTGKDGSVGGLLGCRRMRTSSVWISKAAEREEVDMVSQAVRDIAFASRELRVRWELAYLEERRSPLIATRVGENAAHRWAFPKVKYLRRSLKCSRVVS